MMSAHDLSRGAGPGHEAERAELLRLARESVREFVTTGERPAYQTDNAWFLEPAAVFVTLRVRRPAEAVAESRALTGEPEELRGCVGQIEAEAPLHLAVRDAAIKAATADPRFYPVRLDEVDGLRVEISILSPMRPIARLSEIAIGQDGLLIVGHRRRGLLLPEVAPSFGWDRAEFVRNLCWKAGLPDDAWPDHARLFAFTTEAFQED